MKDLTGKVFGEEKGDGVMKHVSLTGVMKLGFAIIVVIALEVSTANAGAPGVC
jgi:hypothetical protein